MVESEKPILKRVGKNNLIMKKIILVAHGQGGQETFSIPKVKTITPSGENLSFDTAKEYMRSSNAYPEYASTSFGDFGALSAADCLDLFGKNVAGTGIVNTGTERHANGGNVPIYALRTVDLTSAQLSAYIEDNGITSLILLACREA